MFYLVSGLAIFIWSAIAPHDYFTWFLEVAPILIGLPLLLYGHKKFPLTPLLYLLLWIHSTILMVGGHYTYAEVPLFDTLRDTFHLARNHYDRLGHFAQGFIPAILARECLLRKTALKPGGLLFYIIVSLCLAFSAFYELIEWWVAIATGSKAESFLGTQGDPWDTQWDMFLALCGAIAAQLSLSKLHDRQLTQLSKLD